MTEYTNESFSPRTSAIQSIRVDEKSAALMVTPKFAEQLRQFGLQEKRVEGGKMVEFTIFRPQGDLENPMKGSVLSQQLGEVFSFIVEATHFGGGKVQGFSPKLSAFVQKVAMQEGIAIDVADHIQISSRGGKRER